MTNAKDTPADVDKEEDDCVVNKVSTNNDNESLDDLKKQVTEAQKLTGKQLFFIILFIHISIHFLTLI